MHIHFLLIYNINKYFINIVYIMGCDYFIDKDLYIYYKNNNFINSNLEKKYKKLIEDSINNKILNKNIWEDIIKIVKKESRYERD